MTAKTVLLIDDEQGLLEALEDEMDRLEMRMPDIKRFWNTTEETKKTETHKQIFI